jgi:hypothetical protein
MAKERTEDRIYKYLCDRGEQGASSVELAQEFLNTGKTPGAIAGRIVNGILARDKRFLLGADGQWRAGAAPPTGTENAALTVAEFVFASATGGPTPVECGVVRIEDGKHGETLVVAVNPGQALPPGTQLPPGLKAEDLRKAPPLPKVLARLSLFARGTLLASFEQTPLHARVCHASSEREITHLSIRKLARRLDVIPRDAGFGECASALGVVCPEHPRAAELASVSAEMLRLLLEQLKDIGIQGVAPIDEFLRPPVLDVDFSQYDFDWAFLDTLPEEPGVYIMKDANDTPVYVGKASNLRQRVTSYFRRTVKVDERVERIRSRINGLTVERVGSELEALLLEHQLIRDLAPELNVQEEVHERPQHMRPSGNIILVLPSRAAEHVELLLLRKDNRLTQVRVARTEPESARGAIEATYFVPASEPPVENDPESLGLVWSWLQKNKDKATVIDVDATGSLDGLMRLLADYLSDPEGARTRAVRV